MTSEWNSRLRKWVATPVARALVALALMMLIGCLFNAGGAFFRSTFIPA